MLRPLLVLVALSSAPGLAGGQADERARRIEGGYALDAPGEEDGLPELSLPQLMSIFHVPGLSVAVIDGFRVVWAKGYGDVTAQTLFQAGSISKPVAAAGMLSLVEKGVLHLDEDVDTALTSWKVPETPLTRTEKVTLRRILSHCAGFTVHGFDGYPRQGPIPSTLQILDGRAPATNAPVRVERVPGSAWAYSGGGFTVAQQLVEDVTKQPFAAVMQKAVLGPAGMTSSTFEQPLPARLASRAAAGTRGDGSKVPGGWEVVPQLAAAGLWTTASDLARFAIELAREKRGESHLILSPAMARQMLSPQRDDVKEPTWGDKARPDREGLGIFVGDAQDAERFGHVGDDPGFEALLVMFADTGKGVVMMANSEHGIRLGKVVLGHVAEAYGWKYRPAAAMDVGSALAAWAHLKGTPAAVAHYRALKARRAPRELGPDALTNLGYAVARDGRLGEAIDVMRLAVEEAPDYWNAYDSLAELYAAAGQSELARENYEKSVELNPANAHGRAELEKLRRAPAMPR